VIVLDGVRLFIDEAVLIAELFGDSDAEFTRHRGRTSPTHTVPGRLQLAVHTEAPGVGLQGADKRDGRIGGNIGFGATPRRKLVRGVKGSVEAQWLRGGHIPHHFGHTHPVGRLH
jgi:hypothetical protein